MKQGSEVILTCIVTQGPHELGTIFWLRGKIFLIACQPSKLANLIELFLIVFSFIRRFNHWSKNKLPPQRYLRISRSNNSRYRINRNICSAFKVKISYFVSFFFYFFQSSYSFSSFIDMNTTKPWKTPVVFGFYCVSHSCIVPFSLFSFERLHFTHHGQLIFSVVHHKWNSEQEKKSTEQINFICRNEMLALLFCCYSHRPSIHGCSCFLVSFAFSIFRLLTD